MIYILLFFLIVVLGIAIYDGYHALEKRRARNRLVRSYKKFFLTAISEEKPEVLTRDHVLAIGQKFIDDQLNRIFERQHFSESEKIHFRKEFEMLIKSECPENLFESSLIMTDDGFKRKM